MAVKKSELYTSIWKSCDELRGGMDASQYKDYVLVLLFMRYVTDKYGGKPDSDVPVPEGGSFKDIVALKGKPDIGDGINKIIAKFAEANDLQDVFREADFNDKSKLGDGKEMVDKLSKLVAIFENPAFDFSKNRSEGDDLLGDAYEYLMRNFATESGKSKGQFYTPSEVSQIMAKVIGIKNASRSQTVHDPTCGSGSLLLKAADETMNGITIYGQENDVATRALAVMNMWLHKNPSAEIWRGNTLSDPHFLESGKLKTFDFVVANPPFSAKSWTNGIDPQHDQFERFIDFGSIPPVKNGDYAFLLHMIKSMKSTGKAAVILPLGVLFRGNSEGIIRKNIVERGYIKGIIGLPPNLFYGTGIAACILVLDKENAGERRPIFMIAAQEGFAKDGNKNRLRARDIHKIVDVFNNQIEIPKYSRLVEYEEIEKNGFNLNISLYIDSSEEEDLQDIEAHLLGGIPQRDVENLNAYWKSFPNLKDKIFKGNSRPGYYDFKFGADDIRTAILESPEFSEFTAKVQAVFKKWCEESKPILVDLKVGSNPKSIGKQLSESILDHFSGIDLVDNYDVYQDFMAYWAEIIQDDLYLISSDGWKINLESIKDRKGKITSWDCPLLPKDILAGIYFKDLKEKIEQLESELESATGEKQSLEEENSGDDDLFSNVRNEKDKISKNSIPQRIREIANDVEYEDELKVLNQYLKLLGKENSISSKIKDIQVDLDKRLREKFAALNEEEIKEYVIESKWFISREASLNGKVEQVFHRLIERMGVLEERYAIPLPELTTNSIDLTEKVERHLRELGFKW
jgi:type I restriction enzyme M protein